MNSLQQIIHNCTVKIICEMRGYGYSPELVEKWIDKNSGDYGVAVASEYATIYSIVRDCCTDYCEEKKI